MHSFEGTFNAAGLRRTGRFRRFELRGGGGFAGRSVSRCLCLCAAALLLLIAFGVAGPAEGQDQLPVAQTRNHIKNFDAANGRHAGGWRSLRSLILPKLYKANNYNPLWADSEARDQLVQAIYAVKDDGLDPEDYHLSDLLRLQAEVRDSAKPCTDAAADFDLLLTDKFYPARLPPVLRQGQPEEPQPGMELRVQYPRRRPGTGAPECHSLQQCV